MMPIFRAWDKDNKEMFEPAIPFGDSVYKTVVIDIEEDKSYLAKIENAEIMQSTGLLDKNGVEIFEGDIVENTTQRVYLGHRFEVSWNGGYACFQLLNGGKSSNVPLIQDFMSYEVVGNIYENPELVEVEE